MGRQEPVEPAGAAIAAVLGYLALHFLRSYDAAPFLIWLYLSIIGICGLVIVRGLWSAFHWARLFKAMKTPVGLFGRIAFPTASDAEKIGLSFSNADGNGIPLGGVGNKIVYYKGPSHLSYRAANNAGKTESGSALICYALGAHRNIVSTAKGAELAWLCAGYREKVLGQQVVIVDPLGVAKPYGLKTHDFNPLGHLPAYAANESPELFDKSRSVAQILNPEAENSSGENKIFRSVAREWTSSVAAFAAWWEANSGELCANLPYLQRVFGGSSEDLEEVLQRMRQCDAYGGAFRRAAGQILGTMERSSKFAESVLVEVRAPLAIYEPAGHLGKNTEYSDFNVADLKKPGHKMSIFFISAPEKSDQYSRHIGLCLNTVIDECIAADRFEPRVTVVGDEWASLGVLPSALPMLFLGRSRGVQLASFVQQTESYSIYGQQAAAFTTQSEIVMAWAIRSTKDAKEYSERSGQQSIVTESIAAPAKGSAGRAPSITLSERGTAFRRSDEFLQLRPFTAVVFYKENPPITVDLVSYRAVEGWREHGRPMPGSPPLTDLPVRYKA